MIIRQAIDDGLVTIRRWVARPMLPTAVVLTLALGIGATIAVFSIANAVLIKPLPWPDPSRLFAVRSLIAGPRAASTDSQLSTWADWDALGGVPWIERVGVWTPERMLLGSSRSEVVDVIYASSDITTLLGATPAIGRFFRADEDREADNVVILSYGTWTRRFGGSSDALQQPVTLSFEGVNGRQETYNVIGVLPSGFTFEGQSPEFVLPAGAVPDGWRMSDQLIFRVIAKTKPAVVSPETSEVLDRIAQSSGPPGRRSLELRSLSRELLADSTRAVTLLFSAAVLLLVASCASASGLLLGNAVSRRTEVGVRLALGASRIRIARQLAVEHVLLGICASVVGLVLAAWLTPTFIAMAPSHLVRLEAVTIDPAVVTFALCLGAFSPVIFGAAPSLILSSLSGADALLDNRVLSARPHTWQQIFVALQIALAVVLVVSAGLLGGTMLRLKTQPLGFEPTNLVVVKTTPVSVQQAPRDEQVQVRPGADRPALTPEVSAELARAASQRFQLGLVSVLRGVIERLEAIPRVSGVAGADAIPFLVSPREAFVQMEGDAVEHRLHRVSVSADYFRVMGIRVVKGRTFDAQEMPGDAAIVSESFERDIAGGSAIGRRFSISQVPGRQLRIVGVVANVRIDHSEHSLPTFYVPLVLFSHFVVSTRGDTSAVLPLIRPSLGDSDAHVVVTRSSSMNEVLASSIAEETFRASLSALFGGSALILSLVGVNALVVRWVADRRRDLGIRIALGASPADVWSLVLRKTGLAVAAGIGAGVPAAFVAGQLLSKLVVGASAASMYIYVAVPALMAVMALASAWLPVLRAGRLAPVDLFRP